MFQNSTLTRPRCARCGFSFGAGSAHSAAVDLPPDVGAAILCQPCAAMVIGSDAAAGTLIRKLRLGARTGVHRVRRGAAWARAESLFKREVA